MVRTPAELGRDAKDCGVRRGLSELQHDETGTGIGSGVARTSNFVAETVLKHDFICVSCNHAGESDDAWPHTGDLRSEETG